MDHKEAGKYWNDNADVWTRLARSGYDVYRDHLNTPAFLALLPDVRGLAGLDIGCGEGHNTRLVAERGARVSAIDISEVFIRYAQQEEERAPLSIDYQIASAVALPFGDAVFDFAVAFMSLMDVPETERVLAEAHRVLRPGGFLQFSIEHPCFATPHRRNLRNPEGLSYAVEVGATFVGCTARSSSGSSGPRPRAYETDCDVSGLRDSIGQSVSGSISFSRRASRSSGSRSLGRATRRFWRAQTCRTLKSWPISFTCE